MLNFVGLMRIYSKVSAFLKAPCTGRIIRVLPPIRE